MYNLYPFENNTHNIQDDIPMKVETLDDQNIPYKSFAVLKMSPLTRCVVEWYDKCQ